MIAWASAGAKTGISPPGNWNYEPNISGKAWSRHLNSD